ncbi:phospholipid hydroperoxide glutathione peroxidase [Medicago truncatula]|uniref:Glutathione peroxidase n=1 Tax=Medicago truncatula TaxID=3880 RepID=A0A072TUF2_MEDTR|nr:phospholipid hydroperoxide glutathione peroxidase [Medicago truncatula]
MSTEPSNSKDPKSVYDFTLKDGMGNDVDLATYKGKVLLIVNVASKCGMTNSNYVGLNQLYDKYKLKGLEILAFPSNQFGEEEPGTNDQILDFVCTHFKSEFPIFDKVIQHIIFKLETLVFLTCSLPSSYFVDGED